MFTFLSEKNALACFDHTHPIVLALGSTKDKTGASTEFFYCAKCFKTLPATPELKEKLLVAIMSTEVERKEVTNDSTESSVVPNVPKAIREKKKRVRAKVSNKKNM